MVFPIIPILAIVAMLGSGGTLVWYKRLSSEDREKADMKANEYAKNVYNKALDELSKPEARQINKQVKEELSG
jgi:hypothetical protein